MRLRWLLAALLLSLALLALEEWAMANFIFWRYVWFDVPMHFLGGIALGVLTVGLIHKPRPVLYMLFLTIGFIAWELVELLSGAPREANFFFDTALDLLMDTLGALVAYVVARMTIWKGAV